MSNILVSHILNLAQPIYRMKSDILSRDKACDYSSILELLRIVFCNSIYATYLFMRIHVLQTCCLVLVIHLSLSSAFGRKNRPCKIERNEFYHPQSRKCLKCDRCPAGMGRAPIEVNCSIKYMLYTISGTPVNVLRSNWLIVLINTEFI